MTININQTPNRLHIGGDTSVGHFFGPLQYVKAVPFGHPHFEVRFDNNVRVELTPADAARFAREVTQEMARLGQLPDCSGSAGGGEPE